MIQNRIYQESVMKVVGSVEADNKSFLVTGATGLIGSCIIDLIMAANAAGKHNHVYALGRSREKISDRFSAYSGKEFFHIVEQDICQPLDDSVNYDYIIHGASNADPVSYALYPADTMVINLLGTYNILEYCKKNSKCKTVLLSTFEVYGNAGTDVYSEDMSGVVDINDMRSCYPESKRSAEIMAKCYVKEYSVSVCIARLASIYGATMMTNDSKAHAQFIRNALAGEDIVMKSSGTQVRTYCYVIDAVTGILAVLFRGITGESYNISNEKSISSISDVAHVLAGLAGTKVVYDLPDSVEAEGFSRPQNCVLDNTRLRSLGWKGIYTLKEGMHETLQILKTNENSSY